MIKILKKLLKMNDIIGFSQYGSTIYGTNNEKSDIDLLVIRKNEGKQEQFEINIDYDMSKLTNLLENTILNISIMSEKEYQKSLNNQEIKSIECFFSPIKEGFENYKYDVFKQLLRHSISKQSDLSYVKAKKKITIPEENAYIGLKSLFHTVRILDFGIQLCTYGKIIDFKSMSFLYFDLLKVKDFNDWSEYLIMIKPIYKEKLKIFKLLAPKI